MINRLPNKATQPHSRSAALSPIEEDISEKTLNIKMKAEMKPSNQKDIVTSSDNASDASLSEFSKLSRLKSSIP